MTNRICSIDGCSSQSRVHGLCGKHLRQAEQSGMTWTATTMLDRFWAKVDKSGTCWVWTAATNTAGYGIFWRADLGALWLATRVSWEIENGPIPDGLLILHRCDNPPCIRPSHLWAGTQVENIADMIGKGRGLNRQTVCSEGHLLVEPNILVRSNGRVVCRECNRRRCAERQAKLRQITA